MIATATFTMGSPLHVLSTGVCFAFMTAFAMLGRHWRRTSPNRERWLRRAWVGTLIPFQILSICWWMLPANYDRNLSLPLHICDLVVWIIPLAMFTSMRWAPAVVYFWGVGLSSAAFFVPVLRQGPESMVYWLFWISHTQIVGSGIYLIVAGGYRPRFGDVLRALAALLVYAAIIVPIDAALGLDYGYFGRETSSVASSLGPWPGRVRGWAAS